MPDDSYRDLRAAAQRRLARGAFYRLAAFFALAFAIGFAVAWAAGAVTF